MPLIEPAIRPPSEADSFHLQVTTGCSSNRCSFCAAYRSKPFSIKPLEEIYSDIRQGAVIRPGARRVFLMDGDALAAGNEFIVPVLKGLNLSFPYLSRISSYANGYNLTSRTQEELKELRDNKLSLVYIGLESGSEKVLEMCKKPCTAGDMVRAVRKADDAGIKSSVIVLLGLGGRRLSREHVEGTIEALNRMQPRYLSFLSLMVIPGTPIYRDVVKGEFSELGPKELLAEMRDIITGLELNRTVFRSDHASNYIPLEGRFPRDKEKLIELLNAAMGGVIRMRTEWERGL
ncbi:MAG: radical SAM protein [Candidatus Omnitrophica bacterium]|nr:radical SAM protein [Candidatus Omnitrophota bacterium]